MRLIDADALRARMYHDAFETDSNMQKWDSGCWIRYKMFEIAIASAPTIEPEQTKMIKEIRKWINSGNRGNADYFIVDQIEEIINKYER